VGLVTTATDFTTQDPNYVPEVTKLSINLDGRSWTLVEGLTSYRALCHGPITQKYDAKVPEQDTKYYGTFAPMLTALAATRTEQGHYLLIVQEAIGSYQK